MYKRQINVLSRGLHELEEHPVQVAGALDWLPLGDFFEGQWFRMGVNVDPLGAIMPVSYTHLDVYKRQM